MIFSCDIFFLGCFFFSLSFSELSNNRKEYRIEMSENNNDLKIVVVKEDEPQQTVKTTTITTTEVKTVARSSIQSKAPELKKVETKHEESRKEKKSLAALFAKLYIDPFGQFYYSWLIFISITYFYNLIFLIARAAFWRLEESELNFIWYLFDYLLCDLSYIVDILIRFFTGFIEDGELCIDKLKIAKQYMWSVQFKLDVLSILPTEVLLELQHYLLKYAFDEATIGTILRHDKRVSAALRLNRLLRFGRLNEFRSVTETKTKYPTVFRMSNLLINILVGMHWNACIYFLTSNLIGFGHDKWVYPALTQPEQLANLSEHELGNMLLTHKLDVQYIYCFWWSALTLTTVAEVPNPETYYQEIYMSVLLMTGVIILAITIGSAGDMVENANRRNLELQMKCDYAKSFLTQNKITGELEQRIKNYLDYLYITPDLQGGDVLEILPYNLQKEIAMNVHIETLKRVKIFQDCEPGLLEELVTKLKLQIYSPGDYVCRKGDVGYEVTFFFHFSVQVIYLIVYFFALEDVLHKDGLTSSG